MISSTAAGGPTPTLQQDELIRLFREMVRVREFEEEVHRRYLKGLVHGTTHLCQGQEAVSVGAMKALRPDDYVVCTYRGHGHCLARGMDMEGAFAEIFGRATGVCGGMAGSMHLKDKSLGLIASAGIVGGGLPVAVGAATSAKLNGVGQVAVCFFGDGAVNIGSFHEAMNIAAVWKLPAIFVCENNLYGEFTRIDHSTPFEDLVRRADAYAMTATIVDGNDVLAVYGAMSGAVARARAGDGPSFVECKTYRHRGHSRTDPAKYRPEAEVKAWLARDPLPRFRENLREMGLLDDAGAEAIRAEIAAEVSAAADRAAEGPWPDLAGVAKAAAFA